MTKRRPRRLIPVYEWMPTSGTTVESRRLVDSKPSKGPREFMEQRTNPHSEKCAVASPVQISTGERRPPIL